MEFPRKRTTLLSGFRLISVIVNLNFFTLTFKKIHFQIYGIEKRPASEEEEEEEK